MKLIYAALLVLAASQEESETIPVAELLPEYVNAPISEGLKNSSGSNFVFLQKFPLGGVDLFFHTEVLVCPCEGFSGDDQQFLDSKIAGIGNAGFVQIDDSWWTTKTANCVELGYGGAMCESACCSVPHGSDQTNYQLKSRDAVIGNADGKQKSLFIYGTGDFDGNVAWHDACDKKCWSTWKGTDYNPLTNNCNTFTSTILKMVYGLSDKKPHLGPSDMVNVHGHCPSSNVALQSEAMPVAVLLPEYVNAPISEGLTSGSNFVFLQKFPLGGVDLFFHTEVLVCPREGFSGDDQKFLNSKIAGIGDAGFVQIDDSWWTTKTANCVELGYGGAMCESACCSVPHCSDQTNYQLKSRDAVIGNADGKQKSLFIYGTGDFDGNVAWHDACDKKCWSTWKGTDYNPLTNNCNTFTSTILKMVYGLSDKKPHLGPSDMVNVHGHCPSGELVVL